MNHSVFAALNQCQLTDLEVELNAVTLDESRTVRLFGDYKGRHRIVLFIDGAGVSGVMTCPDGEVFYKETAAHARCQRQRLHAPTASYANCVGH